LRIKRIQKKKKHHVAAVPNAEPDCAARHDETGVCPEADIMNGVGVSLAQQGRFKEAIEVLTKVIVIKPDSAKMLFNLGVSYLEIGCRLSRCRLCQF